MLSSDESGFETSAGQLWQFLDQQGVTAAKKLSFCLDLDSIEDDLEFSLTGIELRIESPDKKVTFLTDVSLGENSIVVPGYETSSFKPEAVLEVALGYDFMKTFSATSPEKVSFKFESSGDAICNPTIYLQSNSEGFFSTGKNLFLLAGFAAFWICVFHLLNRFTKPSTNVDESSTVPNLPIEPVLVMARAEPQKVMSA
jgi:hypothetical protein